MVDQTNKSTSEEISQTVQEAMSATIKGAVVYSDGGARPNPGYMGWGAHGYIFTNKKPTQGPGLQKHILTTKGYQLAVHKDRLAEYLVTPEKYFDFMGSSTTTGTNNVAELDALYHTLERLKEENLHYVHILVDSEYVRRGITEWVPKWSKNNWIKLDGQPVANADNWKRLADVIDYYKKSDVELKIQWIKGHSDDLGNNKADNLATLGVLYSQAKHLLHDYKFSQPNGYWKTNIEKHPFLNFRRIYFNSVTKYHVPGKYFQAEPGKDELTCGKMTPDASYSIVQLHEPERAIEHVLQKQFVVSNDVNVVMMMRLDELFSDGVYPYVKEHGDKAILPSNNPASFNLNSLNQRPITEERKAGLSLRAIEYSGLLDELLERFKNHRDGLSDPSIQYTGFQVHDITDTFFEKKEVAKKKNSVTATTLKAEYVVGFRDLKVSVDIMCDGVMRTIPVTLILGLDLLHRNNLKRIEELNPKVHLLTWKESETSIRYACVVECNSAIGIWANYFANRIFVQPTQPC